MEAKAAPRSGRRWGAVRMAEAGRTPDAATPRAMLSARLPAPMNPKRNASPFEAAGVGTGWRGGAAIAREMSLGSAGAGLGGLWWSVGLAGADVRFLTTQRGFYGKNANGFRRLVAPANLARRLPPTGFIGHG